MRIIRALFTIILIAAVAFIQRTAINDIIDSTEMPCHEKLYEALLDQQDSICLIGYGLSDRELYDLWLDVAYTKADLFFIEDEYHYTMLGNKVLTVTPGYTMTPEELAAARLEYNTELEKIRALRDPDWNDLETALFFHDYLCMYYSYDETLTYFSVYDFLTRDTGVCQAYAQLYAELMNGFGIPCEYVVSQEMNHAWNIITIDGEKYNVDVTYDDPTSDRRGRANHKYFLRSDGAFPDHSLTVEEGYGQCTDTRYDSGVVWEDVKTGFVPVGDDFYFIKSGMLYRWDGGEPEYIDTIYATWFTNLGNSSYWKGNHSTLWAHEDMVLYSKPKGILSYTPATGQFYYQYQYYEDEDIYGFSYIDGELVVQLGYSPNEPGRLMTVEEGFRFEHK